MGLLEPTIYGEQFHDFYVNCAENRYEQIWQQIMSIHNKRRSVFILIAIIIIK